MRARFFATAAITIWCLLGLCPGRSAILQIREDTSLDPGVVYDGLEILADGIEIRGNGALVRGPGRGNDLESYAGIGVLARGRTGIVIRGLRVRGFSSGLWAENGSEWIIEDCDFSDNYHDPNFGWGDGERRGGVILTNMSGCQILRCKGNRVWNGLDMRGCIGNRVLDSDFSHCSNVCLKLWNSSENLFENNDFAYGLRIAPGEVHARDSTGVLIESGSNQNRFIGNDVTHGGDGIFIRPLNGWISTGNVFIDNDCSYANNNGFESWSPGNTFINNKANNCSYGFWLGGSDRTVLRGNEASFNGLEEGFHNAPEPDFGHGGIVIVNGSGYHTLIEGNLCRENNGGGIVFRGDRATRGEAWRMQHLIVQGNRLEGNRWGIFARFTDDLFLSNNTFVENGQDVFFEDVTGIREGAAHEGEVESLDVEIEGPERAVRGESILLRAIVKQEDVRRGPLRYHWRIGEQVFEGAMISMAVQEPGFNRVSLTVDDGTFGGLASKELYIVDEADDYCEEPRVSWNARLSEQQVFQPVVRSSDRSIVGDRSVEIFVSEHPGGTITAELPLGGIDLASAAYCGFWVASINAVQEGYDRAGPIVRLYSGENAYAYVPRRNGTPVNYLGLGGMPYPEARAGWIYLEIPLAGSEDWKLVKHRDDGDGVYVQHGLAFEQLDMGIAPSGDTAMASAAGRLYLADLDEDRLYKSLDDGRGWKRCRYPREDLVSTGGGWENAGMAVVASKEEGQQLLVMRRKLRDQPDEFRYVTYDVQTDCWSWTDISATAGTGLTSLGGYLYGIAHAVGSNYGGPLCRFQLGGSQAVDDRSVPVGLGGVAESAWWFSRAAKLSALGDRIYGIKNDWVTPAPEGDASGDRIFCFKPSDYTPSEFLGGAVWEEKNWDSRETKIEDLGALPFEPGHGSALVSLPAGWCQGVGQSGGLFIIAGCSPSNHEGWGAPSDRFCIFDVESGKVVVDGRLPAETDASTSAAFHEGRVVIKRGGGVFEEDRDDVWVVRPAKPSETGEAETVSMTPEKVDRLSIELDSRGGDELTLWIDGLHFW